VTQLPLDLDQARARGHSAAKRAGDRADRLNAQWTRTALQAVKTFAIVHGREFLAEDMREWSHANGVDDPPDQRAWGIVLRLAKREGFIVSAGFAAARSSNGSPKVLWRAA